MPKLTTSGSATGVIRLARTALSDYRVTWKRLIWIVAIIAVPLQLLGLSVSFTADPAANVYGYLAVLILNVALLWAVLIYDRTGRAPRAAEAYYGGSALIIRLFVIILLYVLMLIPLMIGLGLYTAGATALNTPGTTGESIAIILVSLLIALPSFYMLVRYGLALFVAADTGLRPISALRLARQLTLGKFWGLVRRYLGLALLMIILVIPASLINFLLNRVGQPSLGNFFFGLITTFILLPIFTFYLLRLYRSLQPKTEPTAIA